MKVIKQSSLFFLLVFFIGSSLMSCGGNQNTKESDKDTSDTASTAKEDSCSQELFFKISLAEWSLHRALKADEMTNLDFPVRAKEEFGIEAVEYVSTFFESADEAYLAQLKKVCDDHGVTSVLIMVDGEGNLGDTDEAKRIEAVENHHKWVDAAKYLGCHSIRVNARGEGTEEEVAEAAKDGLRRLCEYAQNQNINVIVENHGGYSSDGQWLSGVIAGVGMPNCGTLPDFGNFTIDRDKDIKYDRYKGVKELMPYAKGVSAKSHNFDAEGNETNTDYAKMLKIVKDAGYTGYIGIEYEGGELSEAEGIMATKKLLKHVGKDL